MTSFARAEREAICDLLIELGPSRPTLCQGWSTRDLAAHLVVRESSPTAIGILVRPLAGLTEWARRRQTRRSWPDLVAQVRRPPVYSPGGWGPLERRLNLGEFFVHHEDVRRAQPGWEPRALTTRQEQALWALLRSQARALYRKSAVGVVLDGGSAASVVARAGPGVVVRGPVAELLMYSYGRRAQARVSIEGDSQAVQTFEATPLGF